VLAIVFIAASYEGSPKIHTLPAAKNNLTLLYDGKKIIETLIYYHYVYYTGLQFTRDII
jgi:hypothetical protein